VQAPAHAFDDARTGTGNIGESVEQHGCDIAGKAGEQDGACIKAGPLGPFEEQD